MDNFFVGQEHILNLEITPKMVEEFVHWSGDNAPLHTDDKFAQDNNFKGKIVHGAALFSLVSRFVGVHLPGKNSLWMKADTKFHQPCYAPAKLRLHGVIAMISPATSSVIVDINVYDQNESRLLSVKSLHKIISKGNTNEQ